MNAKFEWAIVVDLNAPVDIEGLHRISSGFRTAFLETGTKYFRFMLTCFSG